MPIFEEGGREAVLKCTANGSDEQGTGNIEDFLADRSCLSQKQRGIR